jgi:hypothetical protein
MRLIGERPQSISGCTLSITTDGNVRAMRHQSTEIHIERKDKSDCSPMARRPGGRPRSVQLKA